MSGQDQSTTHLQLSVRAADAAVELAATTVIRRCIRGLGTETIPLPIPIEEWIENPLGHRFGIVNELEIGAGVLGLARPTLNEILINESLLEHEERFRFTCAHELGHIVLHARSDAQFRDAELPHVQSVSKVEHEADRFAAALLMPVATLAEEIERVRLEQSLAEASLVMLRGDNLATVWLWRRCFLPALAARYRVSRAAMVYRFREIRLPGQRRLMRPSLAPLLAAPERALRGLDLDSVRINDGLPLVPDK